MQKGFSLVELLVVITLISVMAIISVPLLVKQMPKWHMNGTARDIRAKLMMARLRAIQENKKYGVTFTLGDTDSYKVVTFNDPSWDDVGVVGEGTEDINVTLASCVGTRVEFYEDSTAGKRGAGGCAASTSLQVVTVTTTAGDAMSRTISISTYTGNVTID